MSGKHQTTPQAKIIGEFPHGMGFDVALPLHHNYHYGIVDLSTLPASLGMPSVSPRIYWVRDVLWAGNHAHMPGTEKELMICLNGEVAVHVWNTVGDYFAQTMIAAKHDGETHNATFVPPGIWHLVTAEPPSILLVVASTVYDRSYYVEIPDHFFTSEGLQAYRQTLPSRPQ